MNDETSNILAATESRVSADAYAPTDAQFREAAILLMAVSAVVWDEIVPASRALAFAQGIADSLDDPLWSDGKHHGDCTKQPSTCPRCYVEEYEAEARAYFASDDSVPYTRAALAALRDSVSVSPGHPQERKPA